MIEFGKEHSKTWIELMTAYQDYKIKIFNWTKEDIDVKYNDLYIELNQSLFKRDLHKRLLIMDFLRGTDMWDESVILSVFKELTEIALHDQEVIASYARMILKKIKHHSKQIEIAKQVFILAEKEEKQKDPDYDIFHNGYMLLFDLGYKKELQQFIDKYKNFI